MKPIKPATSALLFFMAACSLAPGSTEPSLTLTIEDAVFLSLRNNRELAIQQSNPVIAGAFEQIERGTYDPELFASLIDSRESALETARSTGSQFETDRNDTAGEVGIRQRLPTGGELEATVGSGRNKSNRTPEQQFARVGLTLTQQLLRGFGPSVNLARIRQAALDTEASKAELQGYTEALVADVEMAYWQYVAAREAINVVQQSLELAQTQLEDVEARIEVGALPKNEAAAARAEVSLSRQALIDAQSYFVQQRYTLIRLIYPDLPPHRMRELDATSKPRQDLSPEPDIDERIALALQSRPEIEEAQLRFRRRELETVVTRSGLLPKLELFINLGKSGYADTFSESFERMDGPSHDVTVGLQFSQAIGNRSARARDMIALTTLQQSEEALANLRDLVRFDVLLAINELERARKQIAASADTCLFRAEILQSEQDRFEVGTSTSLIVARAQRDLVESQINEIKAHVAYQIAVVRLYLAEGSLLDRRGIRVGAM